jgi:LmbE family N-acetylglucosaminyl deacetylase
VLAKAVLTPDYQVALAVPINTGYKTSVPLRKFLALVLGVSLLPIGLPAQSAQPAKVTVTKAPPETPEQYAARKLALQEMLQRLTTTGRIMQVVAHPDDEDGAMLTLESRVKGNTAMLFTFTRGEGGQNAEGAVFFDELGILRTLELLASDKEYGAEERFSHVADFGFSKTATESFAKWGGEDVPLKDLVEQVREFQPDVLVARFSGTPKDGHGHHQASALMTVKAFHEAADAKRFPERGERDWQPLKLYTGLAGDEATVVPDEDQPSSLLGEKTPAQVALEGLRFQKSQGLGNIERRGPRPKIYSSYKLVATADGVPMEKLEKGFFEGVNTSLTGLAKRFPEDANRIPDFQLTMTKIAALVRQAQAVAASPDMAVKSLAEASNDLKALRVPDVLDATPSPLVLRLHEKQEQLDSALQLAVGLKVSLSFSDSRAKAFVMPDQVVNLTLHAESYGDTKIDLHPPWSPQRAGIGENGRISGYLSKLPEYLKPDESVDEQFPVLIMRTMPLTRAAYHRDSPVKDTVYQLDKTLYDREAAVYGSGIDYPIVELPWAAQGTSSFTLASVHLFVAPPVSVTVAPATLLHRLNQAHEAALKVEVQNNSESSVLGTVALNLPLGWSDDPARANLSISAGKAGDENFTIHWPVGEKPMQSTIKASFTSEDKTYSENYHLVARSDLPDAFPYYAPAQTTISLIDADIPEQHNIGYIMGAGDTIPDDLTSLGFTVHLLTAEDLASGDLKQYDTIVTGIRAYATRADLREHNQRLLDYVKDGGTFVVQYEQDYSAFNSGHYTPFPATMGRERVSQEEQPVKILDPESSILRYPNRITSADFDNWVQERGLYFMKEWSPDYTPLLSMNDVGEAPLQGGLLVAHYGKGTYIYTGLSFYRELPNGVPGVARLFINLLSAGHNPAEQPVTNARR